MTTKKSRAASKVFNWHVSFHGSPDSLEWGVVLTEQDSCRILNVNDLRVHPDDSIAITSEGRGGQDFVAQWNIFLSTAAINDQNPGSKHPVLDWQDIGWLPLNLGKTRKKPSVKFGFHGCGATHLQIKYSGQPAGGQMRMLMAEKQKPQNIPTKEMVIRITIVVS